MDLIAQGAEAKLFRDEKHVVKVREAKPYRHEHIDSTLRKSRTKREFKVLAKLAENGVLVPEPLEIDEETYSLRFGFIEGGVLKHGLNRELLFSAFAQIMKMHALEIVHGDLTTLNMIANGKHVYLIDFGLANFSRKTEDRAVDLNLFFTCIKNEHPELIGLKEEMEKEYRRLEFGEAVIERLKNIEKRGRNKE